jgi:hypothetical protein
MVRAASHCYQVQIKVVAGNDCYRLAYVDCYGLGAARTDLWPEYSHGKDGLREYSQDVRRGFVRSDNVGFIRRNFPTEP